MPIPRIPSLGHLRLQRLGHTRVAFGFIHGAVHGLGDARQSAGWLGDAAHTATKIFQFLFRGIGLGVVLA